MPTPLVSVIITTHDFEHFIADAIGSALAQDYARREVIVVDDGSTDGTAELLRTMTGFRLLSQQQRGVAAARRAGVDASQGDYIAFLDGDDVLDPRYISRTFACISAHKGASFCYTWMQYFGSRSDEYRLPPFDAESLILDGNHIGIGALQPKRLFYEVGGFDELETHEDWDYWLKALERGHTGVLLPEALYHYRQRSTGMPARNADWNRHGEQLRDLMWRKHRRLYYMYSARRFVRTFPRRAARKMARIFGSGKPTTSL